MNGLKHTDRLQDKINKESGIFTAIATKMSRTGVTANNILVSGYKNGALIRVPHFDIFELETTSLRYMFGGAENFNQNINDWDVSRIKDFYQLFYYAKTFNQPLDKWDVSNVTNMNQTFWNAQAFNQPINSWNVSKVTSLASMFGYSKYNQPLDAWDTSNVTNMTQIFMTCPFNQDLSNWNISKVVGLDRAFRGAYNFSQDLTSWDVRRFASEPNEFSLSSKLTPEQMPIWGTNGGN